jgi:hypothetical protein
VRVLLDTAKATSAQEGQQSAELERLCAMCTQKEVHAVNFLPSPEPTHIPLLRWQAQPEGKETPPALVAAERKPSVGGTLARLHKETEEEEEHALGVKRQGKAQARRGPDESVQGQWNEWNFWRIEPLPVEELEVGGTTDSATPRESSTDTKNESDATTKDEGQHEDDARVARIREEEKVRVLKLVTHSP